MKYLILTLLILLVKGRKVRRRETGLIDNKEYNKEGETKQ